MWLLNIADRLSLNPSGGGITVTFTATISPSIDALEHGDAVSSGLSSGYDQAGNYASTGGTISSVTAAITINGVSAVASDVVEAGDVVVLTVTVTDSAANERVFTSSVAATDVAPVASNAIPDQSYPEGEAIPALDVSSDFTGSNLAFALAPSSASLPAGLSLSGAGLLTGTPTTEAAQASIVVRATNSAGSADTAFGVTVAAASAGNALFSTGQAGVMFSPTTETTFTDTAGTIAATLGDDVAYITDLSGNDKHSIQATLADRANLQATGGGVQHLLASATDVTPVDLSGVTGTGMRVIGSPHGYQLDEDIGLSETKLPQLESSAFIARQGAASAADVTEVDTSTPGDRHLLVGQTFDLTLTDMVYEMANGEAPVVRCVGANGVEATITLGTSSPSNLDLAAAGLTAPATVMYPMPTDLSQVVMLYNYGNGMVGGLPDVSACTALTRYFIYSSNFIGSMPDLSANAALQFVYVYSNKLTGDVPALGSHPSLTRYYIYENLLTGPAPSPAGCPSLQFYYIYSNFLSGDLPDFSACTGLQRVYAYNNQFTGWAGGTLPASLNDIRLNNNMLAQAAVDAITLAVDAAGGVSGRLFTQNGNAAASATGQAAIDSLRAKGWDVRTADNY